MVQFLRGDDPPRHLAEARDIGREYGQQSRASGLTASQAAEAFVFYRNRFANAAESYAPEDGPLEQSRRYQLLMDEVLLGLLEDPFPDG
jgi:hypothetical protein